MSLSNSSRVSVFSQISKEHFKRLIQLCRPFLGNTDERLLVDSAYEVIALHKKDIASLSAGNLVKHVEDRWYQSLLTHQPDYACYSLPGYLSEIWACWVLYSRKSVQVLNHPTSRVTHSFLSELPRTIRVADVGCGFGYTTLGLRELLPQAQIFGTQLETSYQFQVAKQLTEGSGIQMRGDTLGLGSLDLVFASEYFEHFERPVEHLHELIRANHPRYLVMANGFNGRAIGHFHYYKHLRSSGIPAKEMSRFFLKCLRGFGYEKMETKIWNNRPSIWRKVA